MILTKEQQALLETGGEWTLLVGDNAEHLPLAIPHTVAGDCTTADCAADPALGHYLTGQVKDVTDAEMAVLFGHEVLPFGFHAKCSDKIGSMDHRLRDFLLRFPASA